MGKYKSEKDRNVEMSVPKRYSEGPKVIPKRNNKTKSDTQKCFKTLCIPKLYT